jgi:hypothetical protein
MLTVVPVLLLATVGAFADSSTDTKPRHSPSVTESTQQRSGLVQGDRTIEGVVRAVRADQIEVDTGEMQPRFLALKEAEEKGMTGLKPGDKLEIVVNDQNLVVDYHPFGQAGHHKRIKGEIAQALGVGHDKVVIRTDGGKEESYAIRPLARSKTASIPVGAPVTILVDETNEVVDVALESQPGSHRDPAQLQTTDLGKKSPLKGAHERIEGTIIEVGADTIRIKTKAGDEVPYGVRPMVRAKLADVKNGETVILLIDKEKKVVDVAVPPQRKG